METSTKSALIRLAASLPMGDRSRRVLLARLKAAAPYKTFTYRWQKKESGRTHKVLYNWSQKRTVVDPSLPKREQTIGVVQVSVGARNFRQPRVNWEWSIKVYTAGIGGPKDLLHKESGKVPKAISGEQGVEEYGKKAAALMREWAPKIWDLRRANILEKVQRRVERFLAPVEALVSKGDLAGAQVNMKSWDPEALDAVTAIDSRIGAGLERRLQAILSAIESSTVGGADLELAELWAKGVEALGYANSSRDSRDMGSRIVVVYSIQKQIAALDRAKGAEFEQYIKDNRRDSRAF